MLILHVAFHIAALKIAAVTAASDHPDLSDTPFQPVILDAGKELLIECIVRNLGQNSLMWKRTVLNKTEILTVDESRVTSDQRVTVIHNPGSEEWLLSINPVNLLDSGTYLCETNAEKSAHAFRTVIVTSHIPVDIPEISEELELTINPNHTYKDCCKKKGVSKQCLDFCSFNAILSGSYDPSPCIEFIPTFGECMTDGRDHRPCCEEQKLPATCKEVCGGNFKISTIVEHYTCTKYTRSLLGCISKGIELLPSEPVNVYMEAMSAKNINVSWSPPLEQPKGITHYIMDVKKLNKFDDLGSIVEDRSESASDKSGEGKYVPDENKWQLRIDGDRNFWILDSLEPFTMYEVTIRAENKYGSSQATFRQRALTMMPNSPHSLVMKGDGPQVPDIKSCCIRQGIEAERCVTKLCDPEETDKTLVEDFIICAPWVDKTFKCLANKIDHTPCCKQRGLPEICHPFCSGNVTKINYKHFICIKYMPMLTNCVLQGYGVLPSAARDLSVKVKPKWALLQWRPPIKLAHTVSGYHVHYRAVDSEKEVPYTTIERVTSPYMLENLNPNTRYEVYVSAANKYGLGEGSPRVIFKTPETSEPDLDTPKNVSTTLTECCQSAGISPECLPMCDYRATVNTLFKLGPKCEKYSHITVRCAAAGRDHTFCCARRNIPSQCVSLCAGYTGHFQNGVQECNPSLPQIIECMEEGIRKLPGIPREIHSLDIKPTSISLKWSHPAEDGVVTHYEVYIRMEDYSNNKMYPYRLGSNVTVTSTTLTELVPGNSYGMYVVAGNQYGTSLPSYIINVMMPLSDHAGTSSGVVARARPGKPSLFEVTAFTMNEIMLSWKPTVHVYPDDKIDYLIYYAELKDDRQTFASTKDALNVTSEFHTVTLTGLKPDTDYLFWGYTLSHANGNVTRSLKSDILQVHTDIPIPAIIDGLQLMPQTTFHTEGTDIKTMCVTTGKPEPTVRLFLDGELLVEKKRKHVVADINNVTRNMKEVICSAENAYGSKVEKAIPINVVFPPSISTEQNTIQIDNSINEVELQCAVTGNPQPNMMWYRDGTQRQEVITSQSRMVSVTTKYHDTQYPSYVMHLKMSFLTSSDLGEYHCYAENQHGSTTSTLRLVREKLSWGTKMNVTECCISKNVSSQCVDACVFDIDIQRALNKPVCIPELEKMMRCASDGSDHRRCCLGKGVPRNCINWCRGYKVTDTQVCILGYAKQIVNCFEEGNAILPGPPIKLKLEMLANQSSVKLTWEPPVKNSDFVELYRLFWRQKGSHHIGQQVPVSGRHKTVHDLAPGVQYEFLVKAYNHYGKSLPSKKVEVSIPSATASLTSQPSSKMGIALACVTVLLIILVVALAVLFIRKKFFSAKSVRAGGVAFENPSYLKESSTATSEQTKNTGITMSSLTNSFKVQPNVYEELKVPT